jgi:hypothetical protein
MRDAYDPEPGFERDVAIVVFLIIACTLLERCAF